MFFEECVFVSDRKAFSAHDSSTVVGNGVSIYLKDCALIQTTTDKWTQYSTDMASVALCSGRTEELTETVQMVNCYMNYPVRMVQNAAGAIQNFELTMVGCSPVKVIYEPKESDGEYADRFEVKRYGMMPEYVATE